MAPYLDIECNVIIIYFFLIRYRCVPKADCKGNQITPRSVFSLVDYIPKEQAACSDKSEECCAEANIKGNCADYAPDGYECREESE